MNVVVHLGVVWVYRMTRNNEWFRNIRAFPEALDKRGEPDPNHASVLKYVKENT